MKNKAVIVTISSLGIEKTTVALFAKQGADVILCCIQEVEEKVAAGYFIT